MAWAAHGPRQRVGRDDQAPCDGDLAGGGEHRQHGAIRSPIHHLPPLHGGDGHVIRRPEDVGNGPDIEHGEGRPGPQRNDNPAGAADCVRAADAAIYDGGPSAECGLGRDHGRAGTASRQLWAVIVCIRGTDLVGVFLLFFF